MAGKSEADSGALAHILQRLLTEESQKLSSYIHNSHRDLAARLELHVLRWGVAAAQCRDLDDLTAMGMEPEMKKGTFTGMSLQPSFDTVDNTDDGRPLEEESFQGATTWSKVLQPTFDSAIPSLENTFAEGEFPQLRTDDELLHATVIANTQADQDHVCRELSTASQDVESYGRTTSRTSNKAPIRIRSQSGLESHTPWAKKVVSHPMFELSFTGLIFFSALCMGLEQQYQGIDAGYRLQARGFRRSAEETWPWAGGFILFSEMFFGVVFTVEVILKVAVFRLDFCRSLWNIYDTLIVACWLIQNLRLLSVFLPPSMLRLARLGRLMRLLRFAKAFQVLDVLHLLARSLAACLSALLWSAVLVFILMLATAILLVFLLQSECENESIPVEGRLELYKYFGTFSSGFFSMYEITMGNWVPISRTIIENVSDWYIIFVVVYRTLVGFAVLKVVTAIFNAETFRVMQCDDDVMLMHKERQIVTHTRRMEQLLLEGDDSGDGVLTIDEFKDLMADKRVQKWLAAQEIELKDVEVAFSLIDLSGDGSVSAEELVRGLARLKGAARSVDVLTMMQKLQRIESTVEKMEGELSMHSSAAFSSGNVS
eukprot:TRINITY_DN32615_c1_g1_i1.p1 TRINITY_DN32615_c1_g1~~TRINITY_DN32615_c1_g1_i1.p1  ORF type:complete len:599 (+),score=76.83 TRINITY_DN32615_c1_g1_i1:88-1884(+)